MSGARSGSDEMVSTPDTLESRLRDTLAPNLLLVREIGAGGMARVFLAREPALKRVVAVKVLAGELANTEHARARFEREAQAVAALSHPNIVAVHTVGELADGTPYFIMQYVAGRSMSERVQTEGALSVAEGRRALAEVAAALAAAHAQGIIHRDIKPANVLCEDSTGRVLVSDFGIAAIGQAPAPVNVKLTATGVSIGTPQYMSPEQLLAEPVTEKTDVYSLGLLAHEMLAGSPPFKGNSPHELIAAHLRDVPKKLSERRPDVDAELDAVVARCLEKDASLRPAAEEVARRLMPGAGALLEWPPPGLEELHGRSRGFALLTLAGGAIFTAALLVILAAGPALQSATVSATTLLLLLSALAGFGALVVAIQRVVACARLAAAAVRSGYAWLTVLETVVDTRADTGNLIAGSREYATLTPAERDMYRLARVRRELALFLGGITGPLLLLLLFMLGSAGAGSWRIALFALLPLVTGAVIALRAARREHRTFAALRARRTAPDVSRLAQPWNDSFEIVRRGQRVGRGPAGPARLGPWLAGTTAALFAGGMLLLVPLVILASVSADIMASLMPKFANTESKTRLVSIVRPYGVLKDSSITPLDAGRSLSAISGSLLRHPPGFQPLPLPESLPPAPWRSGFPPGVLVAHQSTQADGIPSALTILKAKPSSFSQRDLDYLRAIATDRRWVHWDRLAKARSIDYLGARYRTPLGPGATALFLPTPTTNSSKELAYASHARAAWHLAQGRPDSAEYVLRSAVSVGFLLVDEGTSLLDQLIGTVIVGIAREGLFDLWNQLGDRRGARLKAQHDSIIARIEASIERPSSVVENIDRRDGPAIRASMMRAAGNPRESRGTRLSLLNSLSLAPCTNLRELIFGPDPKLRELFESQRAALTRFPSDAALLDVMLAQSTNLRIYEAGIPISVLARVARVAGAALGNERLASCVMMIDAYGITS